MLLKGATTVDGGVAYEVDISRFDEFFTALSCGLIYKSQKSQLPPEYIIAHIYHQFVGRTSAEQELIEKVIGEFYDKEPLEVLAFGSPDTLNKQIYTCEIHGLPNFEGSITVVHRFFGVFKVTSMLTRPAVSTGDDHS